MTTQDVGRKLVEFCRQGKNVEAIATLYAADIVSVEAFAPPGKPAESHGLEAVKGKSAWWSANHEVHAATCSDAMFHGPDQFACVLTYDITRKATGKRLRMEEVAVYTVAGGKIVREQFYYDPATMV